MKNQQKIKELIDKRTGPTWRWSEQDCGSAQKREIYCQGTN
jgi:hypothetical protein